MFFIGQSMCYCSVVLPRELRSLSVNITARVLRPYVASINPLSLDSCISLFIGLIQTYNGNNPICGYDIADNIINFIDIFSHYPPYSIFCICSLIFSNSLFMAPRCIEAIAFDPMVLTSRFISCNKKSNFLPTESSSNEPLNWFI